MENRKDRRAYLFEQDLLWSVLDQDAVPHVLEMALEHRNLDAGTAYDALRQQAALGRVRAYRGTGPFTSVDLAKVPFDEAAGDFGFFVEPTDAALARLREIAPETAA